ncbi:hypothetical protein ACIQXV_24675 [Neobacillus sp. NPDC097160]|uniref:hypothetical protein n=1 Tax=Neobacillus sp. NPDC097160 TaxID=3364298 RepID=UPI003821DE40
MMSDTFIYDEMECRVKEKNPNMVPLLNSLAYGERQYITFVDRYDRLYRDIVEKATKTPFGLAYRNGGTDEWDAVKREWFDYKIKPMLIDDAHEITLPIGHPQKNILYIAHPLLIGVYYPAANFHPLTLETKYFELINLLSSLGAKEIEVEYLSGLKRESSFNIKVDIGVSSTKSNINSTKTESTNILYKATLEGKEPSLPEKLSWFHNEISWQQLTNDRMNYGLKEFQLAMEYNNDFGIDDFIKSEATFPSLFGGVELGGKYVSHQNTVWKIKGTF